MDSERLSRWKEHRCYHDSSDGDLEKEDQELASRIISLLNDPQIDSHCMVDAYYYDFSVIPRVVQEKLRLYRDAYLVFGITTEGELISKWVDRWDLDSNDPIVDGKVTHPPFEKNNIYAVPEIARKFDPNLLSYPVTDLTKLFGKQ